MNIIDNCVVALQILGLDVRSYVTTQQQVLRTAIKGDTERGSVTIENVIWAAAVIVLAAIVITVITTYLNKKVGEIK